MLLCALLSVIQSIRAALTAFTLKIENLKIVAGLVGKQVCLLYVNIVCILLLGEVQKLQWCKCPSG